MTSTQGPERQRTAADLAAEEHAFYASPASPIHLEAEPAGLPIARFLIASLFGGLTCPIVIGFAVWLPPWLAAGLVVCVIAVPVMWILLPQVRRRGLRSISGLKLATMCICYVAASLVCMLVASWALFALRPFLGLPPMPSD